MSCYKFNETNVVLTEKLLIELIREKLNSGEFKSLRDILLKTEESPSEIVQKAIQEATPYLSNEIIVTDEGVKEKKYIGVTAYLEADHVLDSSETLLLNARVDDVKRRENSISILVNSGMSEADARASYDEQIKIEKYNSKIGTYIHNLVHVKLMDNGKLGELKSKIKQELEDNNYELLKGITDKDSGFSGTDADAAISKLEELAQLEINFINRTWPIKNRAFFATEAPLFLDEKSGVNLSCSEGGSIHKYKGLIGIADFIIVNKDGSVIIGDFKVSSKPYSEWVLAKKNKTDYQLGLYRAILAQKGIPGEKIELYTLPIYVPKQNLFGGKIPNNDEAGSPLVSALGATNPDGTSRLNWSNGEFTLNLRTLGLCPDIDWDASINHTELENKIQTDFGNIIGDHEDIKKLNKQKFIDDFLKQKQDAEGNILGWYFVDYLNKGTEIFNESKEEFTKEGGLIDGYLLKIQERNKTLGKTIIDEIKNFKKNNIAASKQTFLHSFKNPEFQRLMQDVFGKYSDPTWEIVEEIPELLEHNILLFKKKIPNGKTIIEAVIISDKLLDTKIPINGQEILLGKYLTTEESRHITEFKPLSSDYKNVKALELISILNTIANNNSDTFKNVEFSTMKVINTVGKQKQDFTNVNVLIDNFSYLCQQAGIKDNYKAGNIKTANTYEQCMSELQSVLYGGKEDDRLKIILSDLDPNQATLYARAENIKKILKKMQEAYPKFSYNDFSSHRDYDINKPEDLVYLTLSMAYNYCKGINLAYDGRITKYGLNVGELFKLMGMPFFNNQANVLKNGNLSTGWLQGLYTTSPQTNPSEVMRLLTAYYDLQYQNVRTEYLQLNRKIMAITQPYVEKRTSALGQMISSANIKTWENLLEHNSDGTLNPDLKIKNPWDPTAKLSDEDRQFLKEILWEINKYVLDGIPEEYLELSYKGNETIIDSLQPVREAKSASIGTYFNLPLCRADDYQLLLKLKDSGVKKFFSAKLDAMLDAFDYRQLHSSRAKQIDSNRKLTDMYNVYKLSKSERKQIIETVNNPYNFVFDLEKIACDVAFQTIRKRFFDDALILTETTVAAMHYMQNIDSKTDFQPVLEAIDDLVKVSITNQPVIGSEFEDITKATSVVKKLNSIVVLAARPLQFLKELTFGQFTNYSRAWALKYTSNSLSMKTVFEANKVIWGQSMRKYGKAFTGSGSLQDFTLCEALNKFYGIANEDLNRLVDNSTRQRLGFANNLSRWMYIANSAPDYYNRLTLFVAKMMEDGCFDAHTLDEFGNIVYDWKKDKRFSELAKYGLNSDYKGEKYLQQKALYRAQCEELEKGSNEQLIIWDKNAKKYIFKDLPQAYTTSQRNSIKEVADTAYGFYDHETKSLINHKFFGLIFLQFQTFLSAKINLWFKAKPKTKGDNTSQGKFVFKRLNGEILYRRLIIDADNNLIDVELVPESQLTPEEKGVLEPQMVWEGDYIEGLFYSIGGMLHDIFHLNWKGITENKYRLANVKLALHDLLIGIILFTLLKFIFSAGTNKMKDIVPSSRILLRAMQDVGPQAMTNLSFEPSFVSTWTNLKNDGIKLLFNGDADAIEIMSKRFGASKDFIWED